ncbi:hypothetical protein PG997_002043 [Apiospora hydei]|uniref:Uncharacterized protein n=1 Tax=Apiospora hydei TaxID=1337664 RepID=A0ABR1X892_9PEZI
MTLPMKTDQTPFMRGDRLDMLQALDCSSYYELSLALSQNASALSLHTNDLDGMSRARLKIEGDRANGRPLAILLHCIPRALMRSIIAGTVAYDSINQSTPSPAVYSADGAGTYVAGVAIQGRNGKFLNYHELLGLAAAMEDYCKSYARQKSRWIADDRALRAVELFAQSLRDRLAAIDHDGLSKTIFHIQSPLMVGYGNSLRDCMPCNTGSDGSNLRFTAYTWGLMLCCIQARLQLTPQAVVQPVVHVLQNGDLAVSEVLVTALASSYCFQDGVNVVGAGATSGRARHQTLMNSKKYMFCEMPYWEENYEATSKELEKRSNYVSDVWLCSDFYSAALKREIEDLETQIQRIQIKGSLWEELMKRAAKREEELRKEGEALDRAIKSRQAMLKIFDYLLGNKTLAELSGQADADDDVD